MIISQGQNFFKKLALIKDGCIDFLFKNKYQFFQRKKIDKIMRGKNYTPPLHFKYKEWTKHNTLYYVSVILSDYIGGKIRCKITDATDTSITVFVEGTDLENILISIDKYIDESNNKNKI